MNTSVGFNSTYSGAVFYSGVEILAANVGVGVKKDQGPWSHSQYSGPTDSVTYSTTYGAVYVVLVVSGSAGSSLTATVGSTTLSFQLLVSGDHTGQDGGLGATRLSAIYGAYASGNLTNEVTTVTFNQTATDGIGVWTLSGVVSSNPVGITVSPAWQSAPTSLDASFAGVTTGSQCVLALAPGSTMPAFAAHPGSTALYTAGSQFVTLELTSPAGIAITAATVTGSGGFVVGGSAVVTDAYALGNNGLKYSALCKSDGSVTNYLSISPSGLSGGVLCSMWARYDCLGNIGGDPLDLFYLEGSNWRIRCLPQSSAWSSGSPISDSWGFAAFVDLFIGNGAGDTSTYFIVPCEVGVNKAILPYFKTENFLDFNWYGTAVIPTVNGISFQSYMQESAEGVLMSSPVQTVSLATIRSTAIAAGMPSAQANAWVPDLNCSYMRIGSAGSQPSFNVCRARLHANTVNKSAAVLSGIANNPYPDPTAYGDWALNWTGSATGTGVNTNLDLSDQSGNGHPLILNSGGRFFLGKPRPILYPNVMLGSV